LLKSDAVRRGLAATGVDISVLATAQPPIVVASGARVPLPGLSDERIIAREPGR
jgi:hypothetical protein